MTAASGAAQATTTARAGDARTHQSSAAAAVTHCTAEAEPNDHEVQIESIAVPGCIDGTLPETDQDMFLWEVPAGAPLRWVISLTGVAGTVTAVKILAITSDPGVTPVVAGAQVYELDSSPLDTDAVATPDLLFAPGGYLVGLTRTATADGGAPPDLRYTVAIEAGAPLPATVDREPNDDPAHAAPCQERSKRPEISRAATTSSPGGSWPPMPRRAGGCRSRPRSARPP